MAVWPIGHTAQPTMSTRNVSPPIPPPPPPPPTNSLLICSSHDIAGYVQKISQKLAISFISYIMIAIALLYFKCKSYMATIKHMEAIIL